MHQFPSPYNTGPQACEGLGETRDTRFSRFVFISALLHLALMCSLFHWHGKATNSLIAGDGVIEINLVSIPAMKKAVSIPHEPDAMRDEAPVGTPAPEVFHSPAAEKVVTPAAPAAEKHPPPVEKLAETPAPVQEEAVAPIEAAGATASHAPAEGISNKTVRHEAAPVAIAEDSGWKSSPDGSGANAPVAMDTAGTITPEERTGASPGQRYIDENFYYVKELITRNLTYPVVARRMKWQGTVVVSFIVLKNGEVEDIRVVTGSGHNVLDKNVIATIQQVQPFPAPPAAAEFTMPIKYTLKP